MLLHFIFVIKETELGHRDKEFDYVKMMGQFYKVWIKNNFSIDVNVQCDQMITKPRSLFQRIDTSTLLQDHAKRGEETYHFYLCNFRPIWTDCTCEGYHAENFGMTWWQSPKKNAKEDNTKANDDDNNDDNDDILFLAEKNCTIISHELAHELLRQKGVKKYIEIIHDLWTKHLFANLPFEQYGKNFEKTQDKPFFLTLDTSGLRL